MTPEQAAEKYANQHQEDYYLVGATPIVDDEEKLFKAFLAGHAHAHNRWVKVEDGLPETDCNVLCIDRASTYKVIGKDFAHHGVVDHNNDEYVREGVYHTNTIEGAFSLLDRMIIGIYHNVSKKHLQAYCNEVGFRYNSRKITDKDRFDMALVMTAGVKLNYETLIGK